MDKRQQELIQAVRLALGFPSSVEEAITAFIAAVVPGFYDGDQVDIITQIRPSNRRALIRNGLFPPGILLGPRKRVWPRQEIHAWVANQLRAAREHDDIERAARLAGARMVEGRRAKQARGHSRAEGATP